MFEHGFPSDWSTLKKLIWLQTVLGSGGGGGTITTVTGISPLLLANALAKPIKSLTQYGLCTQEAGAAPSTPKGIMCNNGALQMVDDELPAAYKRVLGFTCDNNAMWQITGFKLKGSDTVRISFSVNAACNVFGCYQGADATDNYDLYVSTSSGSKYFRYGNGTYLSAWSAADLGERFDVVYTPYGSQGMPQDSTWSPLTFESANDLLIGATTFTGTSSKLKGNLYGSIVVDGRLKLIPCERVSDGVLGYYDTYGATFYEPYEGFDGAVSLGYDGSHYALGVVGTAEVLTVIPGGLWDATDNAIEQGTIASSDGQDGGASTSRLRTTGYISVKPNTQYTISNNLGGVYLFQYKEDKSYLGSSVASGWQRLPYTFTTNESCAYIRATLAKTYPATSAAVRPSDCEYVQVVEGSETVVQTASVVNLFAVGDSADTQEIISGAVNRKVGVLVLDGTETWSTSSGIFYIRVSAAVTGYGRQAVVSTHYVGTDETNANMPDASMKTANNSGSTYLQLYCKDTSCANVTEFKAKLAAQYAAGTPVIVLYRLAEETTEQVAGQALHTSAGDNVVSVSSNVDPVTLEAEYVEVAA